MKNEDLGYLGQVVGLLKKVEEGQLENINQKILIWRLI